MTAATANQVGGPVEAAADDLDHGDGGALDQGRARLEPAGAAALTGARSTSGAGLDGGGPTPRGGRVDGAPVAGQGVEAAASTRARAVDSNCLYCGRRMSPGKWGKRRYCSNACRTGAYKKRRRAAAGVTDGT